MPEYTRLTRRHSPVWSSRVETDVSDALNKLLGGQSGKSSESLNVAEKAARYDRIVAIAAE